MNIKKIEYIRQNYKDNLLEKLFGNIFHLTTNTAFGQIRKDRYVYHNRDGRIGINTCSEKSFGRNNGYVCLFDLRNENESSIKETLMKYYFLAPSWFTHYDPEFMELNLVYLLLYTHEYDRLIPNEIAKKGQYVPKTECWFPGNMPLQCIREAFLVRIIEEPPKGNDFLFAHYLLQVENYQKRMEKVHGQSNP